MINGYIFQEHSGIDSNGRLDLWGTWRTEGPVVNIYLSHKRMVKTSNPNATPTYEDAPLVTEGQNHDPTVVKRGGRRTNDYYTVNPLNFRTVVEGFTIRERFENIQLGTTNQNFVLHYEPNILYVKYHLNGGTLAFDHSNYVSADGEDLSQNGDPETKVGLYNTKIGDVKSENYYEVPDGSSNGFPDTNNPNYMNLKRIGYKPKEHAEWYTPRPRSLGKLEYDQRGEDSGVQYMANDVAAASDYSLGRGDVHLDFYVNWIPENYTVTFNANGGNTNTSTKSAIFDEKYGTLPVPQKVGNSFKGWSYLPEGYKQLDYIQSTGTQYINTGYTINQRTGVIADYQFTDLTLQQRLFGVQGIASDSTSLSYQFYINSLSKWAYAYQNGDGNWVATPYDVDTSRHTLQFNALGNGIRYDNNERLNLAGNVTQSPSANSLLYLFACSIYDGSTEGYSKVKMYGFTIYEDDVLLHKYIPCQNPQGEVGLYDIVTGEFKGNSGTGSFIAGTETFVKETDIVKHAANHTLYAKWEPNEYTIEYYMGNTKLGESTNTYGVSQNLLGFDDLGGVEPQGWEFSGWSGNNGINDVSVTYVDEQSVINLIDGEAHNSTLNDGDYVYYVDSNGRIIKCMVLYDNNSQYGQNGIQIIAMESLYDAELSGDTECEILDLNDFENDRLNTNLASSVRCVGTLPDNPDYCDAEDTIKNYLTDLNKMILLDIDGVGTDYWLGSSNYDSGNTNILTARYYDNGELALEPLAGLIDGTNWTTISATHGYRPVYTLKSDVQITGGNGTVNHPYIINGTVANPDENSVRLYAIFERNIKFNSGVNGTISSTATQYFNPVDASLISEVQAPDASLTGIDNTTWVSNGYRADKQASNYEYIANTNIKPQFSVLDSTTPTSTTLNLYAIYQRYLTMNYDGNGATGGTTTSHISDFPQYYNASGSLTSYTFTTKPNGYTRPGYDFDKWAEDGISGNQYAEGANVAFAPAVNSSNTTKTMYALWNAITYSITYDLDGGSELILNPTSYTTETPTFILNNPTKQYYTFIGWTGTGLDIPQKSVAIPIGSMGDRSYVANWAENTVSVTISKDDHFWSDSGMSVGLYQNGVEKYSTVVTSGNTATFNRVEAGEYDVYAGKNSNDKTTMVDTGQDVQVGE